VHKYEFESTLWTEPTLKSKIRNIRDSVVQEVEDEINSRLDMQQHDLKEINLI
jgi:hypothetical protein